MRTCFDTAYSIIAHAINFIIIAANDSFRGTDDYTGDQDSHVQHLLSM